MEGTPEPELQEKNAKSVVNRRWLGVAIVVTIAVCVIVMTIFLIDPPAKTDKIRVVEELTYYIYDNENRMIGMFETEVSGTTTYQGVKCYQANCLLMMENSTQSESMFFDENGKLRYCVGYSQFNGNISWLSQTVYYWNLNKQHTRVIYPDAIIDNETEIPNSPTIAQHFLYLLRFERLENGYYREFNFSSVPDTTQNVAVGVSINGEETIQTPAGNYDCWTVDASGGYTARFWAAKENGLVVQFVEGSDVYVLQGARYWQ